MPRRFLIRQLSIMLAVGTTVATASAGAQHNAPPRWWVGAGGGFGVFVVPPQNDPLYRSTFERLVGLRGGIRISDRLGVVADVSQAEDVGNGDCVALSQCLPVARFDAATLSLAYATRDYLRPGALTLSAGMSVYRMPAVTDYRRSRLLTATTAAGFALGAESPLFIGSRGGLFATLRGSVLPNVFGHAVETVSLEFSVHLWPAIE